MRHGEHAGSVMLCADSALMSARRHPDREVRDVFANAFLEDVYLRGPRREKRLGTSLLSHGWRGDGEDEVGLSSISVRR